MNKSFIKGHAGERSLGVNEKKFSVPEVSEPQLFDSTPLRLWEFPLRFPSAGPTLGKEGRAGKIYVDVSNENITLAPPYLTIFCQTAVCLFFLEFSLFSSFYLNVPIPTDELV